MSTTSVYSDVPKMQIFQWFLEPQFYLVACIYMATRIFVNVSMIYMTFYLQYTISLPAEYVAVVPLVMYLSGLVVSIILKILTKRFGFKMAFIVSCLLGVGK